jgi:hypothetical protein
MMLACIFGMERESFRPAGQHATHAPFYFVWPPKKQVTSCFALDCGAIDDRALRHEVQTGKAWAFTWAGSLGVLRWNANPLDDYGVIVAQRRRRNNQLWLVLAGLSGPGTFAAARSLLNEVEWHTPRVPEEPEALYAIVRASVRIEDAPEPSGDRRVIEHHSLIVGPEYWSASSDARSGRTGIGPSRRGRATRRHVVRHGP